MIGFLATAAIIGTGIAGWAGYRVGRASADVDHAARHAADEHRLLELAAERDQWRGRALRG